MVRTKDLKAGGLAKEVHSHLPLGVLTIDKIRVNEFRKVGIIPLYLVNGDGEQRLYDEEAVEWILLALRIRRVGGDATYEKIGEIFREAVFRWGHHRETLSKMSEFLNEEQNYPKFVRRLRNESLNLPEYIALDGWLDAGELTERAVGTGESIGERTSNSTDESTSDQEKAYRRPNNVEGADIREVFTNPN